MGLLHRLWQQWQKKTPDNLPAADEIDAFTVPHFIGGSRRSGTGGRLIDTADTAHCLYAADARLIAEAADAFRHAEGVWARTAPAARAQAVRRFAQLLEASRADWHKILMREQNLPAGHVQQQIDHALTLPEQILCTPSFTAAHSTLQAAGETHFFREPVGLIAAVRTMPQTPGADVWLTVSAFAAGNGLLLLPPASCAAGAVFLAELWQHSGLPDGIFNIIQNDAQTIADLAAAEVADAVIIEGTLPENWKTPPQLPLAVIAAPAAAAVIFPDADIPSAAQNIVCNMLSGSVLCLKQIIVIGTKDTAAHFAEALRQAFAFQAAIPEKFAAAVRVCATPEEAAGVGEIPLLHLAHESLAQTLIAANPAINTLAVFGRDIAALRLFSGSLNLARCGVNTLPNLPVAAGGIHNPETPAAAAFFSRTRSIHFHWSTTTESPT